MKGLAIAVSAVALALLTFFQFPGHTWLQQDSQVYAPVLEHQRDPSVLRSDILVKQPLLEYTIYDGAALALREVPGLGFREVLAFEQVLARALGIWGLSVSFRFGSDTAAWRVPGLISCRSVKGQLKPCFRF